MPLELVYFSGGPRERVLNAVLEAGYKVRHVYVNDPTRWPKVVATMELTKLWSIQTTVIIAKAQLGNIKQALGGALCLSAGFNYLFSAEFLKDIGPCINIHGTLLPKYAGARTLNWVIARGERESGVTVHLIDEGIDTGPILCQSKFPLSRFESPASLMRKTLEHEPAVVLEALALFEQKGLSAAQPQSKKNIERLPDREPTHSKIDPNLSLNSLYDIIRACDPDRFPAYFVVDGQKVCVRLWRPEKPSTEADLI